MITHTDLPLFAMSHRTDPTTSKQAIADLTASGIRGQHMQIVLSAVKSNPGLTACELIAITGLDEYQVRRRLSDLKNSKAIEHSDKRQCRIKGTSMVTWTARTNAALGLLEGVRCK
jgi:predicted HTH transcriptional regulator